jgi:hypothetical protein
MNRRTATILAVSLSVLTSAVATIIFIANHKNITLNCSYLDPPLVDVIALLGSIFLIGEGFLALRRNGTKAQQLSRVVRILFGASVLTIHVLQVYFG